MLTNLIDDYMAKISKNALVSYSADQMYELVDDVPSYKDFLPWCSDSKEVSRKGEEVVASVSINKGAINKTFTTKNTSENKQKIHMELVEGPFKKLVGFWVFQELKGGACKVSLELDYEFSNRLLSMAIGPIFNQVGNTMVDSFVARAKQIYG